MPAQLPYVAFPGSFNPALEKIRWAATPGCVTMDVATTEQKKGRYRWELSHQLQLIEAPTMASSTTKDARLSNPARVDNEAAATPVKLLSGGNPQIPKGDGDAPVQAYVSAMPGWKSSVGRRIDALITLHLPNVQKAVRWNSPFYGIEGNGWLVSFHVLTRHVQVNFFCGSSLDPVPPGKGKDPHARWLNIGEGDQLDEEQLAAWLKQAANLKGWASFSA